MIQARNSVTVTFWYPAGAGGEAHKCVTRRLEKRRAANFAPELSADFSRVKYRSYGATDVYNICNLSGWTLMVYVYIYIYARVYIGFLQTLRRDAGEITIRTINIIRFKDRPQWFLMILMMFNTRFREMEIPDSDQWRMEGYFSKYWPPRSFGIYISMQHSMSVFFFFPPVSEKHGGN